MRGVVSPELSVARPRFARCQRTDDRGTALFAGFHDEPPQIPTKGVNDFCLAGPLDAFGFLPSASQRAVTGGPAVIIRAELQQNEVTLLDEWPHILPEESAIKAAAA